MAKKISLDVALIIVILTALFTWSFYKLIYTATGDILMSFGITNEYWQNIAILVGVGAILYLFSKDKLKGVFK